MEQSPDVYVRAPCSEESPMFGKPNVYRKFYRRSNLLVQSSLGLVLKEPFLLISFF